jgi:hypothetical protein
MLQTRRFSMVFVGESHGTGGELTEKADKIVEYSGKTVTVKP